MNGGTIGGKEETATSPIWHTHNVVSALVVTPSFHFSIQIYMARGPRIVAIERIPYMKSMYMTTISLVENF